MIFTAVSLAVMLMVTALHIGLIFQRTGQKRPYRVVSQSPHAAVKPDAGLCKSLLRPGPDTAADNRIRLQALQKARKSPVTAAGGVRKLFPDNLPVRNVIDFHLAGMPEVLEYLTILIRYCDSHNNNFSFNMIFAAFHAFEREQETKRPRKLPIASAPIRPRLQNKAVTFLDLAGKGRAGTGHQPDHVELSLFIVIAVGPLEDRPGLDADCVGQAWGDIPDGTEFPPGVPGEQAAGGLGLGRVLVKNLHNFPDAADGPSTVFGRNPGYNAVAVPELGVFPGRPDGLIAHVVGQTVHACGKPFHIGRIAAKEQGPGTAHSRFPPSKD